MNINEVIKYPILSEKSYQQKENNVYIFAVDVRTNKSEVKKVVEYIFDVEVKKVNIFNVSKKPKNVGKFKGFTSRFKKAFVTLKKGSTINIFPEESSEETKKDKPLKNEKIEIQKKSIEEKAAAKIAAQKDKKSLEKNTKELKNKVEKK